MREYFPLLMFGVILSAVSVPSLRGYTWTIHQYHRRNIREQDAPAYARAMGIGTLVIGVSIIVTAVCLMIFNVEALLYLIVAGVAAGVAVMLYAQRKYNGGLF